MCDPRRWLLLLLVVLGGVWHGAALAQSSGTAWVISAYAAYVPPMSTPDGYCQAWTQHYGAQYVGIGTVNLSGTPCNYMVGTTQLSQVMQGTTVTCTGTDVFDSATAKCVPAPVNACTGLTGTSYGPFNVAVVAGASRPTSACVSGCTLQVSPSDIGVVAGDGAGHYWATGLTGTYGSAPCTGTTDPVGDGQGNAQPVPNPPPPGMCPGTVNGQQVNVPCAVSESSNAAAAGSSITQGPSPSGAVPGTSSTSSDTKCEGGQCTTTDTTKTNNSDGTTTTTVTSSKTTQDDYCAKNSGALVCQGVGKPKDPQSGQFYAKKDKTVASVLGSAKDTLMASPVGSGVSNFFTVSGGGACPDTAWHIPFVNAEVSSSIWCSSLAAALFAVIRGVLLIVAGFMAFRVAVDN